MMMWEIIYMVALLERHHHLGIIFNSAPPDFQYLFSTHEVHFKFGDTSRDFLLIFNSLTKIYTITRSILNLFSTHYVLAVLK